MTKTAQQGITVIYDGECPFCSNFVRFMALKRAVGPVKLIDARSGDAMTKTMSREGYDLNEGMIVLFADTTYYGADAVSLISTLSDDSNVFSKLLSRLLKDPRRAKLLYPWMKAGRRLTLMLLGRKAISSELHLNPPSAT
jgi:predicted DCC family thiol-disulfide oxidoreductase YuxK